MHVLVIDDDEAIREVMAEILADAGHEVGTARDGDVALELIQQREPDLLLVDLFMPIWNGTDLLRELRRRSVGVPAILMTASPIAPAGELAQAILRKPFHLEDLLEAVQRAAGAIAPDAGRR